MKAPACGLGPKSLPLHRQYVSAPASGQSARLKTLDPTQAVAFEKENASQNAPLIHTGLAMRFGKASFEANHLPICQLEDTLHIIARFCGRQTCDLVEVNWP
ncbi:hypothetical protein AB838_15400 [Rhodobacteraceae bacterium (ex Bugula neritina AB1)]|nr:hypothetical protein AB838_15400 [Rhodobacteraceae bacterium (ex Bugula neritina AB1)]